MRAPKFPVTATWLGTDAPLSLADLRGHVLLLDFWTYCCVNCMHVLPIIERLEGEFENEPFHVVGVHSGKFDQEKDVENIRRAIDRHGVRHPVLVDSDHDLWSQYAIKAWPTLVLIDPEGRIVDTLPGESRFDVLRERIAGLLREGKAKNTLASTKRAFSTLLTTPSSELYFPGKVRVFGDEMAISDTGRHRILWLRFSRDIEGWPHIEGMDVIGGGGVGQQDGSYARASFRRPQGVDRNGDHLYICDTENYLLRRVNLKERSVSAVAGNGELRDTANSTDPFLVSMRSPWDCMCIEQAVLIAMAGSHQIWLYEPNRNLAVPVIGTGQEAHVDGSFGECALAQPSSLFRVGNAVLFADSETSSIRIADLNEGVVGTLIGRGLFEFGDGDGPLSEVLLQHPLHAVSVDREIYVADTFNNKIKKIDPEGELCRTFYGDGSRELLSEPGGLDVDTDFLYIADTNNHRILVLRRSDRQVRTLSLK